MPLSETDLHRLLGHWQATNTRLGVTGVLLYSDGHIMQVLEGDAGHVHALFATIATDVRHRSITKLADGPVQGRAFANWSMRFKSFDTMEFERYVERMKAAPNHGSSLAPLIEVFKSSEN